MLSDCGWMPAPSSSERRRSPNHLQAPLKRRDAQASFAFAFCCVQIRYLRQDWETEEVNRHAKPNVHLSFFCTRTTLTPVVVEGFPLYQSSPLEIMREGLGARPM
jgi:hypothetical protein